jgi:hypothetical protein
MRNQKVIKNATIPKEIEKYIIDKIKNINEYIESKVNIVTLVITSWYISYIPFEDTIIELINKYLLIVKDTISKNTVIIFDNLMRKKERPFDTFYAGDLSWLLGVYLNTLIFGSKLVTYRNKNMESNFPKSQCFPFDNYCKQIYEITDLDIFRDISNYIENDFILYITKSMWNSYNINKLESIVCNKFNLNQTVIIWELKPSEIISSERYKTNFIQGFSAENLNLIENIIKNEQKL